MTLLLVLLPMLAAPAAFFVSKAAASRPERAGQAGFLLMAGVCAAECLLAALAAVRPELAVPGTAGGSMYIPVLADQGLLFEYDGFRRIYTVVLPFMWLMTSLFSPEYFKGHQRTGRYCFFTLMTLGAAMGVFLSGNFFTALVFFEVMSFTSFPWVIQEETADAVRAAGTYLAVAVIGGLAALMGIFLLQHELGTTDFSALAGALQRAEHPGRIAAAGGCILAGFGAKAGMFPLHIWLPKAHPAAPAPASALLSGALTKSGIFGILALSCVLFRDCVPWGALLLSLGAVTMLLGAVMALFSVNLKRTLACSSMSQIGFILVGTGVLCLPGEHAALAASGVLLHMVNHSLFKLVLFIAAGAVYMNAHTLDLTALKGAGKGHPVLMVPFLLGALGISGIPGFSGYLSKTLLHEGIAEAAAEYGAALTAVEWVFLFSGGLTLAYMTKLFVCLFADAPEAAAERKDGHAAQPAKAAAGGASGISGHPAKAAAGGTSGISGHPAKAAAGGASGHAAHGFSMNPLSATALWVSALLIPLFGLAPSLTLERVAALGTDFFRTEPLLPGFRWFSFGNLRGSLVSVAVAAVVYIFFVRKCLIRDGKYVNRWPAKLDLEDAFYRPLLLRWLPGFFGALVKPFAENRFTGGLFRGAVLAGRFLARCIAENRLTGALYQAAVRAGGILARGFSDLPDALVLLLRNTLFRPLKRPDPGSPASTLSYKIGAIADRLDPEADPGRHPHASGLYERVRAFLHATHNLTDSLSFALLLLGLVICGILIYVLVLRG